MGKMGAFLHWSWWYKSRNCITSHNMFFLNSKRFDVFMTVQINRQGRIFISWKDVDILKHFKKKNFPVLFSFIIVLGFLFILYFNLQSQSSFITVVNAQMYMNYASFIRPSSGLIYTFPEVGDYFAAFMGGGPFSLSSGLSATYDFTLSEYFRDMNTERHYYLEPWVDSRHFSQISDTAIINSIGWRNSDFDLSYTSIQPATFQQWGQQPWSRSIFPQQDIGIWDFYRSGYPSQMLINTY